MTKSTRRDDEKRKPNRFGFVNHGGSKKPSLADKLLQAFEDGKGKP